MRMYRTLFVGSVVMIILGLCAQAALSLGFGFDKWSHESLTLSVAIALSIGLLVVAAFCFWACDLVVQFNAVAGDTRAGGLNQ